VERLLDDCIVKIEYTRKTRNGGRPLWDVTGRGYEQEK